MLRSLSARILVRFAVLTIAFGVITATLLINLDEVESEVDLIGNGYVAAALQAKDLEYQQQGLQAYLDQQISDEKNIQNASHRIQIFKKARGDALDNARAAMDKVEEIGIRDPIRYGQIRKQLELVADSVARVQPKYDALIAHPPIGLRSPNLQERARAAFETLDQLKVDEGQIRNQINSLAFQLQDATTKTIGFLEHNQHTIRTRTIYLGLTAVVLGLVITTWVVITLRPLRRLREGARRIATGDYASRIDPRGPAEVAELAAEFNSMARAVEERERELVRSERLAAVGKMAAMITHEVRNPLSSIGLNTELLEDELAEDATEARSLCRSITHEVDRLTAITEEYLAFARLPKPKIAAESINTMIGALAAFVRQDLGAKKVELVVDLDREDPQALVDAAQIRQCLINLVRNAADAVMTKGKGTVTLRSRRAGSRVMIEVDDDGVGIPADVVPRLFDPFFSTKEGGSGLGLALTQQIVKDHGGDLGVVSTVGRGTTFTLSVPAVGS